MAGIEFRRQPQLSVGALDKSVIKKMKRGQNVEGQEGLRREEEELIWEESNGTM